MLLRLESYKKIQNRRISKGTLQKRVDEELKGHGCQNTVSVFYRILSVFLKMFDLKVLKWVKYYTYQGGIHMRCKAILWEIFVMHLSLPLASLQERLPLCNRGLERSLLGWSWSGVYWGSEAQALDVNLPSIYSLFTCLERGVIGAPRKSPISGSALRNFQSSACWSCSQSCSKDRAWWWPNIALPHLQSQDLSCPDIGQRQSWLAKQVTHRNLRFSRKSRSKQMKTLIISHTKDIEENEFWYALFWHTGWERYTTKMSR